MAPWAKSDDNAGGLGIVENLHHKVYNVTRLERTQVWVAKLIQSSRASSSSRQTMLSTLHLLVTEVRDATNSQTRVASSGQKIART